MATTAEALKSASERGSRMRKVVYTDRAGYFRAAWIRDDDPDEMAEMGIPIDPPDLETLDWEGIKRDIHNALVHAELFTWQDVLRQQNSVGSLVARVIKRHIVRLYRFEDQHANGDSP